ncbi:uncharacterized protein BX663DRAFT_517590 [Cokeromyces recurvatus]|uniref:uncharacterized protein n=1 Tax=Cokeromyces recurvatus TaxID=90255 RepID=UPI00221FB06D|nr:uncharacterized protein BX663DRAFT_517590 [Cokeromyces recurvatus]KAI7900439.1 hypothetical protein BX663DRAFT_517590 [Cokeromyces recurvatus]
MRPVAFQFYSFFLGGTCVMVSYIFCLSFMSSVSFNVRKLNYGVVLQILFKYVMNIHFPLKAGVFCMFSTPTVLFSYRCFFHNNISIIMRKS